jgi:hypothetical protein
MIRRPFLLLLLLSVTACEKGCARRWVEARRTEPSAQGLGAMSAVDCPDGLARCEASVVSASRLATVPAPCSAPPPACSCPWDVVAECPRGCVAEGVEVVVDRALAAAQLCTPGADAGALADMAVGASTPGAVACDEGQRYLCSGGVVVECRSRVALGRCLRGCYAEGASIDDDAVGREDAFAILCSR